MGLRWAVWQWTYSLFKSSILLIVNSDSLLSLRAPIIPRKTFCIIRDKNCGESHERLVSLQGFLRSSFFPVFFRIITIHSVAPSFVLETQNDPISIFEKLGAHMIYRLAPWTTAGSCSYSVWPKSEVNSDSRKKTRVVFLSQRSF